MKEKLVLIGNGMAGVRTIEELLKIDPDKYEITVFGAEPYGNYNRIMLSPVLAGDKTIDEIMINNLQWYEDKSSTSIVRRARLLLLMVLKPNTTACCWQPAPTRLSSRSPVMTLTV